MILPSEQARATPGAATTRAYFGKYPGIVVNRTPVTDSHHRGELTVRVPGILEEDPSGGQRPLEVVAKPCFVPGFFYVPEESDQVWVEFAAGDINSPIWSGVWYPADGTPETVEGELPTEDQKVLRTVSGQVVYLEDTPGAEKLVLVDEANDNRVEMNADGIRLEHGGSHLISVGSAGIKLETGGCSIELSGSNLTISNGVHTLAMGADSTTLDFNGLGAQALLLAPLLDWLKTHQHIGNMGAPTPLFPVDLTLLSVPVPPKKSAL